MSQFSRRQILALSRNMAVASVAGGMLFPRGVLAQQQAINIGTFGSTDPQNFARATGAFQKLYGEAAKIDFVTVRAGSEVIAAMAGGSLDLCNIGSSPMVVGYANGIKLSMVWAYKNIIDSECLAVRKGSGISTLADLKGRKLALPFNTSVHFAALAALKTAGLGPKDLTLLNMRADQILPAWQRGDIEAAYIWVPVLPRLVEAQGEIIFKTGDLADKTGLVIFDALVVRDAFKQQHPELVQKFLIELRRLSTLFKQEPKLVMDTMTKFLNVDDAVVQRSLDTFYPVPLEEMLSEKWMGQPGAKDTGVLKTLRTQAEFLKESGQINQVPADFSGLVDASFAAKMA